MLIYQGNFNFLGSNMNVLNISYQVEEKVLMGLYKFGYLETVRTFLLTRELGFIVE